MSKAAKIWLIVAASLVALGILVFGGVMAVFNWDIFKFTTRKYETNTYEISDEFNSLNVNTDTSDIVFLASDNDKCQVVCYEEEKSKHSVGVENGALSVNMVDTRKWYDHINIGFSEKPTITVYLPKTKNISLQVKRSTGNVELSKDIIFESIDISGSTGRVKCYSSANGTIKIKSSTGDIHLESLSAGAFELSASTGDITASAIACAGDINIDTSTGDIKLDALTCKNLASTASTGEVFLKDVIASERFDINTDTGKVAFDRCDARDMSVKTDTGSVNGTLLSDKIFFTKTDTGSVDVPKSTNGGICEIETDTGNIKISIVG